MNHLNHLNQDPLIDLLTFIECQCQKYNIDISHGIIHSRRCLKWAQNIMNNENDLSEDEKTVVMYAITIHDLCDKKYVPLFEAISDIRNFLEPRLSTEMIEAVLGIIQTMSYSFLNQRKIFKDGKEMLWFPDHGKWTRAYHITRHADLLDGYHVGRCYLYNRRTFPDWSEDDTWNVVSDIFQRRIYRYISDGWITHPYAISVVPSLEEEAKEAFRNRNWEYKDL
jgi:hypothetical protein